MENDFIFGEKRIKATASPGYNNHNVGLSSPSYPFICVQLQNDNPFIVNLYAHRMCTLVV